MTSSIPQNHRQSITSNYGYDVFLNHRGPDTKKGFAGHLYNRLCLHGIRVFLDKEEMQEGEEISHQIETAIKTASVHVAIFSKNYAESNWCLNELVLMVESMVESSAIIIPVFHGVKPADLRWTQGGDPQRRRELEELEQTRSDIQEAQQGQELEELEQTRSDIQETQQGQGQIMEPTRARKVYAEGLQTLKNKRDNDGKQRYDNNTIEKWRGALSIAAYLSGFELEACDGYEGELVEKIVKRVLKIVNKTPFSVPKYEIGLDKKVKDFADKVLKKLQQSRNPQVVGIEGLGGVGKTTLANQLFLKKKSGYRNYCFFPISQNAARTSLDSLFGELFKSLSCSDLLLNNVDVVKNLFNEYNPSLDGVKNHPSLVVLDGVDNVDQGNKLLSIQEVLHSKSLILITSRHKNVLTGSGVEEALIYTLNRLNNHCSRKLFCFHAFHQAAPFQGYEYLVVGFLRVCNGLPLLLEVFGAFLYENNDRSYWEDLLDRFEQIQPHEIEKKLKFIYDGLDIKEQHVFLDIACVFMGESTESALEIWKGSGWKGSLWLQTLVEKRLVKVVEVDSKNCIKIHDQLEDLGKNIAEKTRVPRPLWPKTNNDADLLQESGIAELRRNIDALSQQSSKVFITIMMMMAMMNRNMPEKR